MKKYICTVCSYVYDEEKGSPEQGIAPGTPFSQLDDNYVCPICGASKAEFKDMQEEKQESTPSFQMPLEHEEDLTELSTLELSVICSNLAKGCEKQCKHKEKEAFFTLAEYFKHMGSATQTEVDVEKLSQAMAQDLDTYLPYASECAQKDRGALRALVWNEKVTRILNALLNRYKKEGDNMLKNTGVYVCSICGFVYVGDTLPEVCPVCKVPNFKFIKV